MSNWTAQAKKTRLQKLESVAEIYLIPLAIWAWIVTSVVLKSIRQPVPFSVHLLLLPLLPFIVIQVHKHDSRYNLATLYYWLAFPLFLAIPSASKLKLRGRKPLAWFWCLVRRSTNLVSTLVTLPLLFVTWVLLFAIQDKLAIYGIIAVEISLLFFLLMSSLRWVCNPLRPFEGTTSSALNFVQKLSDERRKRYSVVSKDIADQMTPLLRNHAMTIYQWMKGLFFKLALGGLATLFCCILIFIFIVTATSFGVASYALQSCDSETYGSLEGDFLHCWVFSLSVLTTAPVSNVILQKEIAFVLYGLELLCTFLIISVFFSMFSTTLNLTRDEQREKIKVDVSAIDRLMSELFPNVDASEATPPIASAQDRSANEPKTDAPMRIEDEGRKGPSTLRQSI